MIKHYFAIRVMRTRSFRSSSPDSSCARSKKEPALSLLQSSLLSLTVLCSTSGNRRNEEHYSGGWKTPLITSRRAVRYPPDLPLPRPVVCGSPKLPSHFLGEDRRDYARVGALLFLLYFVCCFALVWNGQGPEEGGKGGQGERRTTQGKRGTLERWKWI